MAQPIIPPACAKGRAGRLIQTLAITMTINRYRALIIAFVVLGLLGGALDLIFPSLVPPDFRQVQEAQDNSLATMSLLLFGALLCPPTACFVFVRGHHA